MIVTRTWLDEWIDLSDISTDEICKTLNAIGLEVDSVKTVKMPQKCVVGYVKSRKKHPDADKLSVCEVDIGSSIVTIVCGAPNVDKDQWVAVALEGAELPDGLKIKKASLRGVESNGMICFSTELGLPKINDGIMVLDSSLGELKCGKNLSELNGLEDDFIEIGLTPNRGDCLSVRGVARDLSAAFKRPLKEICCLKEEDNLLGIGRILTLHAEEKIKSNLLYHAFEQKKISSSVLMELRLAAVELSYEGDIERLISYATYSTGVLLRAYDYKCFKKKDEKAIIELKKDKRGFDAVFGKDGRASCIGYLQEPSCKVTKDSNTVVIEASFTPTKEISVLGAKNKDLQSDKHFYRSSRGSETDLALGVLYLWKLLENEEEVTIYAGGQKISNEAPPKVVILQMSELLKMIGQEVSKNSVVNILKWLSFDVSIKGEQEILNITVPPFRHDIFAPQDICEEIIRVIGIDNIESKPLKFFEKSRINETLIWHNFKNKIRLKAASVGFFESIHYLFDSKEKQDFYGLKSIKRQKELSNPITVELNTLRTSLLLHLLEAASNNIKNGKRSVALFELGRVFDSNRKETTKLSFIFSGESEFPSVSNHGKPKDINFFDFTTKIKHVIGEIRVESSSPEDKLSNPYEYASVYQDQKKIGYIARVHKLVENRLDLPTTYIAEIEVEKLMKDRILAKAYSKFPTSSRDLSFLVPKDMAYHTIRHALEATKVPNLDKFYPIDKFEDESLGEFMSLTMSFRFQNSEKTLEDSEVDGAIELIQKELKKALGIAIR